MSSGTTAPSTIPMNWKNPERGCPIVTGATKLVSLQSLYIDTGWESLAARREKHKQILYYKMQNGLTPEYFSSLVQPSVGSTVRYALRNNSDLQTIPAKSQQYYKSFLPSATRLWNGLSEDKRNSPSMTTFKSKLNSNINRPPAYYYIGSRLRQVHHTRLGLNCSPLNQHLFHKNIIDNPSVSAGQLKTLSISFLDAIVLMICARNW